MISPELRDAALAVDFAPAGAARARRAIAGSSGKAARPPCARGSPRLLGRPASTSSTGSTSSVESTLDAACRSCSASASRASPTRVARGGGPARQRLLERGDRRRDVQPERSTSAAPTRTACARRSTTRRRARPQRRREARPRLHRQAAHARRPISRSSPSCTRASPRCRGSAARDRVRRARPRSRAGCIDAADRAARRSTLARAARRRARAPLLGEPVREPSSPAAASTASRTSTRTDNERVLTRARGVPALGEPRVHPPDARRRRPHRRARSSSPTRSSPRPATTRAAAQYSGCFAHSEGRDLPRAGLLARVRALAARRQRSRSCYERRKPDAEGGLRGDPRRRSRRRPRGVQRAPRGAAARAELARRSDREALRAVRPAALDARRTAATSRGCIRSSSGCSPICASTRAPRSPRCSTRAAASGSTSYRWLFRPRTAGAQNHRIRTMLEREAFRRIHAQWQSTGYPFPSLVPSLATALGTSADRPDLARRADGHRRERRRARSDPAHRVAALRRRHALRDAARAVARVGPSACCARRSARSCGARSGRRRGRHCGARARRAAPRRRLASRRWAARPARAITASR